MGQSIVKNPRRIFSQQGGGGGSTTITTVADYASLPLPADAIGEFRWVSTATGVYLVGLYYSDGVSWSASEANEIIVVANYSALPAANTVSGQFYWCSAEQGSKWWPGSIGGTYYNSGMYYSNGTTWEWLNVPYNATQVEVHTGADNTKFVTPSTFAGEKDVTGGIVGLTLFKINFKNVANTFTSFFTNINTAARTYTFQDKDGTVAHLDDINPTVYLLDPVLSSTTLTPPGSPTLGDRYLINGTGLAGWSGKDNQIAEWDGAAWIYTVPVTDNIVFVTSTSITFRFNGSAWVVYGTGVPILQNGNTLGGNVTMGTNDNYGVIIKTNNVTRATMSNAGVMTFISSPIVPTVTSSDSSTKVASTAFVQSNVSSATKLYSFLNFNP